jgi:hypothetical protein
MSASLGPEMIDRVIEGAQELAIEFIDRLDKEYSGLGWRQTHLTDEQHARWFYHMATSNPNWVKALPYVEDGMKEFYRFERTMGWR